MFTKLIFVHVTWWKNYVYTSHKFHIVYSTCINHIWCIFKVEHEKVLRMKIIELIKAENLFQVTIERWEIQFVQLFTWYLIVLVKHDVNMKISASYCYITFYLCRGKYSHVLYKIIFFEKLKENNYRRVPFRVKLQKRFKVFITFTMYLLFHKQGFYSQRRFSVA